MEGAPEKLYVGLLRTYYSVILLNLSLRFGVGGVPECRTSVFG